jgi:hypothetical protein
MLYNTNPGFKPPFPGVFQEVQAMINRALKALVTGVSSVFGRTGSIVAVAGDYTASQVTNVPSGAIVATDVQAAINELDTDKQPLDAELTSLAGLSVVQGDTIYASAVDTYSKLAKNVTATRYVSNQGISNNPSWNQVNLTNGVTGILPNANGGTGTTTAVVDYSATSTAVGWSSLANKYITYVDCGTYFLFSFYLFGTSNATTATITMPFAQNASLVTEQIPILAQNNGLQISTAGAQTVASSTTLTFIRDRVGSAWTNSGTKEISGQIIVYK